MIKIVASYGLKLPAQQQYSSESFHATAEVEVADSLANKPGAMQAALHSLWDDLKQAVANEIGRNGNGHAPGTNGSHRLTGTPQPVNRLSEGPRRGSPTPDNGRSYTRNNGNGHHNVSNAPASKRQVGFLLSLARRKRNFSAEQTREWLRNERQLNLNALSKSEAASLIDELNVN